MDTLAFGGGRVTFARFAGFDTGGDRRPIVDVILVLGPSDSQATFSGVGVQAEAERLVEVLNGVESCFPELLPVSVDYEFEMVRGAQPMVAVTARCLGGFP